MPNKPVYMDYQASTPLDPTVLEAMMPYLTLEFGNPHSSEHTVGWQANNAIDSSLNKIASCLNVDLDEVFFTSGATESNNLAILGISARAPENRKRILVSAIEHKCVLAAARAAAAKFGLVVEKVPVDPQGYVDLNILESMLSEDVFLVSIMAANNEIGTLQDTSRIAAMSHNVGALLHTDAAQMLPTKNIDAQAMGADLISISGHKIYAPKGIGAILVRRDIQERIEPLIYGGGQQSGLRSGTLPVALCVGLARAIELMSAETASDERVRIRSLRDQLWTAIKSAFPSASLNGPPISERHAGNLSVGFKGCDAHHIIAMMQPNLAVSSGAACSSGIPEPSHVLRAIGLSGNEAESTIRFGLGRFSSEKDVRMATEYIHHVLHKLTRITYGDP